MSFPLHNNALLCVVFFILMTQKFVFLKCKTSRGIKTFKMHSNRKPEEPILERGKSKKKNGEEIFLFS